MMMEMKMAMRNGNGTTAERGEGGGEKGGFLPGDEQPNRQWRRLCVCERGRQQVVEQRWQHAEA